MSDKKKPTKKRTSVPRGISTVYGALLPFTGVGLGRKWGAEKKPRSRLLKQLH
jgi:hypothetical protein